MANQPDTNNDDIFAPLPSTIDETRRGTPPPPYEPPLYDPQKPVKKGPNILLIALLTMVGAICVCGACVAVFVVGVGAKIVSDPTIQAIAGTVRSAVIDVPDTLPSSAVNKGTIAAGDSVDGALDSTNQLVWKYAGTKGETITINATMPTSGILSIGIYGTDDMLLTKVGFSATNINKRSQTLTYLLPDDGTYSILFTGAVPSFTFDLTSSKR